MNDEQLRKRVVIYTRVSTDDERQKTSPENQANACRNWCAAKGWDVVTVESDEGISGTTMDRPGWKRVRALVRDKTVDVVMSSSLDRMSRNVIDFLCWVRDELKPAGVGLVTVNESIDTESYMGGFLLTLMLALAEMQAYQTRQKTRTAMRSGAEAGKWMVKAPFGTKPGQIKGIPIKDPETWPMVELIFQLAASGFSGSEILQRLKIEGAKGLYGGDIAYSTLDRVVHNRFYKGEVEYKGEVYPALHNCVIDSVLWEQAQQLQKARRGPKPKDYVYLLPRVHSSHFAVVEGKTTSGFLPWNPRYSVGKGGQMYFTYYRRDKISKYGGLKTKALDNAAQALPSSVRADLLDAAAVESLAKLAETTQAGDLLRSIEDLVSSDRSKLDRQWAALGKKLDSLKRQFRAKENGLVKAAEAGADEAMRCLNLEVKAIRAEIEATEGEIDQVEQAMSQAANSQKLFADYQKRLNLIRGLWQHNKLNELRKLLDELISWVDVRSDGATVYLKPHKLWAGAKTMTKVKEVAPTGVEPVLTP